MSNWPQTITVVFVGVNVTGFAGCTNVVVQLQQQDENGVYQTIGQTAALTATWAAAFSVGVGTSSGAVILDGRPYRIAWTTTGVFITLSFQVGVSGR